MNRIDHPIKRDQQGPLVLNLQRGLLFLLWNNSFDIDPIEVPDIVAELQQEQSQQFYGDLTQKLVQAFQELHGLSSSGEVDASTAERLNDALKALGVVVEQAKAQVYVVAGQVRQENGLPAAKARVRASHVVEGGQSIRLGEDTTDTEGLYTIRYDSIPGYDFINLQVSAISHEGIPAQAQEVIEHAKILETVNLDISLEVTSSSRIIEGLVLSENGIPLGGLELNLYQHNFGEEPSKLEAISTKTLADGRYALKYEGRGSAARLEIRAVQNSNEVVLSKPLDVLNNEPLSGVNLVAPASVHSQNLKSEHERMTDDLINHKNVREMADLANLREDSEKQDITELNRNTGWDARLIALASVAERLAVDPEVGLSSKVVYALLRAGLPSDKQLLADVKLDVVEEVLKKVDEAGIAKFSDTEIDQTKDSFTQFSDNTRMNTPIPGGQATYGELLKDSGLSKTEQQSLVNIHLNHNGDSDEFWGKVHQNTGLNEPQVKNLKLQGKFAFVTGSSAPMTARLLSKEIEKPEELVRLNFHRAETWRKEILEQSGVSDSRLGSLDQDETERLAAVIPTIYVGNNVEDRLDIYAEDMARQIRLSYPTQVIGHLTETDEKFRLRSAHDETKKLLNHAITAGFRFGETSVDSFLEMHPDVQGTMTDVEFKVASQQLKGMQNRYQMAPGSEAMSVLSEMGVDSAYDLEGYSEREFIKKYEREHLRIFRKRATPGESTLVFRKKEQIQNEIFYLVTTAKQLESSLQIAGVSPANEDRERVINNLIKQVPTLESLFGSMDYCECEHCHSVLSPAAYLVDLLQFLDMDVPTEHSAKPSRWKTFRDNWKNEHNGEDYPYRDKSGNPVSPYDVLVARRPDLPAISLTCENTHTALPYVDVVNEILEYYVAHGELKDKTAKNTGEATTAELLAEPQNIIPEAYEKLNSARYPLTLPFDIWRETIRAFCNYFETPLHRILEVFRRDGDATAPIRDSANVGNAEVVVATANAERFKVGMLCSYSSTSVSGLSDETLKVSSKISLNSEETKIVFSGVWKVLPMPGDLLVYRSLNSRMPVFHESIELSPKEVDIFINDNPLSENSWYELYGYPSSRVTIKSPFTVDSNKTIISVSVDEAKTVKTGFAYVYINHRTNVPGSEALRLESITFPSTDRFAELTFKGHWADTPAVGDLLVCDCDVSTLLTSAKALSKRLGVTYKEIKAIIQTEFVNPKLSNLTLLYKLGIGIDVAKLYQEEKEFFKQHRYLLEKERSALPPDDQRRYDELSNLRPDKPLTGLEVLNELVALEQRVVNFIAEFELKRDKDELLEKVESIPFSEIIVLSDPDSGCNFDLTTLQYADGKPAEGFDFLRINLFVRLWRKLGWTIEETDRALVTFTPKQESSDGVEEYLRAQPLQTTLTYLAHLNVLDEKLKLGKQSRLKLLTLWSNIPTTGENALYGALFLKRSILKTAPVFDDPFGEYLQQDIKLKEHILALQGALGLTADEIGLILKDSNPKVDFDSVLLSLNNVSVLYRYSLLAKGLKLSVSELIMLIRISGYNPFKALHSGPLKSLGQDYPFTQTLEFVEVAEEVKGSGFSIEDLSYLLLHRFDETGKHRPDRQYMMTLLRSLSEGLRTIQLEHYVPSAPHGITEEFVQQKLGLLLSPDVVAQFLGMVDGTAEFTVTQTDVAPHGVLPSKLIDEPGILAVDYDEANENQKLTYQGVLFEKDKVDLQRSLNPNLTQSQRNVLERLLVSIQKQALESIDGNFTATLSDVSLEGDLSFIDIASDSNIRSITYDTASSVQTLVYHGVLTDQGKYDLKQRFGARLTRPQMSTFEHLLDEVQSQIRSSVTNSFTSAESSVTSGGELPAELMVSAYIEDAPYSSHTQEQKLTLRGVLTNDSKSKIIAHFDSMLNAAQKDVLERLLERIQESAQDFFDNQLKKQTLRLKDETGFLDEQDFTLGEPAGGRSLPLFAPLKSPEILYPTDSPEEAKRKQQANKLIEKDNHKTLQKRYERIALEFLPVLQKRLMREFVVQTMTAQLGVDAILIESFLVDERLLAIPASLENTLSSVSSVGINATFFDSDDKSGLPQATGPVIESANTRLKDEKDINGDPLGSANSAFFEGYLEVPVSGAYRFYLDMQAADGEAKLEFSHLPQTVFLTKNSGFLELEAGMLYHFSLDLQKLGGGHARLLVQGGHVPKGALSQLKLYPAERIELAERAIILLSKALILVQTLGLSEREIRYLLTHSADFDSLSFNHLPTQAADDTFDDTSAITKLFGGVRRLIAYARLKQDLAVSNDDLIPVFEASSAKKPSNTDSVYSLIRKLTRWDEKDIRDTAQLLVNDESLPVAFENERQLQRLSDALHIIKRFGASPDSLKRWARNVNTSDASKIARDLKDSIKSRFERENWYRVAQPIFDGLRQRQRDALVPYIMHQEGFDRIEQLYEYFLIDPGMEPVVQTSRIRLAISSLQLFIQRCLLNLEPDVHPSTINSKHWEWMKRYRVWEANRKIFLFPENWLEPEFRDDKTYLFSELEGALLQGDVSNDLAEDAFLSYLRKLDELARLDIIAMHVEGNSDPTARTLHVFGRTYSLPHKYFYRRYLREQWTPWEPISADIEGDHLAPVVWRDRLYLFWVAFMEKPVLDNNSKKISINDEITIEKGKKEIIAQLHWSEYINGDWSSRESSHLDPSTSIAKKFTKKEEELKSWVGEDQVSVHVSKEKNNDGTEGGVFIHISPPFNTTFYLVGRNSVPDKIEPAHAEPVHFFLGEERKGSRYEGLNGLEFSYSDQVARIVLDTPSEINEELLGKGAGRYTLTLCDNSPQSISIGSQEESKLSSFENEGAAGSALKRGLRNITSLTRPIFYQDSKHTFHIQPYINEVTLEEWDGWVVKTTTAEVKAPNWKEIAARFNDEVPFDGLSPLINPSILEADFKGSLIQLSKGADWLINSKTAYWFNDMLIGPKGHLGIRNAHDNKGFIDEGSFLITDHHTLTNSGLEDIRTHVNVVGDFGFASQRELDLLGINRFDISDMAEG